MTDITSLEVTRELIDGRLTLRIPLEVGGNKLAPFARAISATDDKDLIVVIPPWMAEKLRVDEGKPAAAAPRADVVATIAADGRVTFSMAITAGRVRMRVESAHSSDYEFQFRRILPGYTVAEALAWRLNAGPTTPRPFQPWAGLSDVPAAASASASLVMYCRAGTSFQESRRLPRMSSTAS